MPKAEMTRSDAVYQTCLNCCDQAAVNGYSVPLSRDRCFYSSLFAQKKDLTDIRSGSRRRWDSNPRAQSRTKRFRVVPVTTTSVRLHIRLLSITYFNSKCLYII